MRVLGIDCGGEYTGYGVVEILADRKLCCLTSGAIKLSPREPLPRRLSRIYMHLGAIINEHQPDEVAIEDVFYALNVKSALKLGQVRGVAMLAAASAGLEVAEYSPLTIKSSVVGYGRAEKSQVQQMVRLLLGLDDLPGPLDVSDAPGVLLRVLGICQRRGAQVLAMTYAHPRLELAVSADERHLGLLRGRLENAVDVLSVDYGT